jgi:hypothetical protein
MMHTNLELETCPKFLFPAPAAMSAAKWESMTKRDALVVEHLALLNQAFCNFYERVGCGPATIPDGCSLDSAATRAADVARSKEVLKRCVDEHEGCAHWVEQGECARNPMYMHSNCAKACGSCATPIYKLVPADLKLGDWKYGGGRLRRSGSARSDWWPCEVEPWL